VVDDGIVANYETHARVIEKLKRRGQQTAAQGGAAGSCALPCLDDVILCSEDCLRLFGNLRTLIPGRVLNGGFFLRGAGRAVLEAPVEEPQIAFQESSREAGQAAYAV
jgi:hypothetical protein